MKGKKKIKIGLHEENKMRCFDCQTQTLLVFLLNTSESFISLQHRNIFLLS